MPLLIWTSNPAGAIQAFETRHKAPDASGLFMWAQYAVESLYYLDDIDRDFDARYAVTGGHNRYVVDVAHVRWATGTCITALDLCAAGLGRSFCAAQSVRREFDLGHFNPTDKRNAARRTWLPQLALHWVDYVCGDSEYKQITKARHSLVHSRLPQHFSIAPGAPPIRVKLDVQGAQVPVRDLIEVARDVATRHVSKFFDLLVKL